MDFCEFLPPLTVPTANQKLRSKSIPLVLVCHQTNDVDKQLEELALADLRHIKVLLLGAGESGKSTVVKQARVFMCRFAVYKVVV